MSTNTFFSRFLARSTPEKRLSEIENLSSANPEHLSRLRALSTDSDPQVRLAAARGIGLRDQLCKLLAQETDSDVRREIMADLFTNVDDATARETAALLARHTPDNPDRRQLIFDLTSATAVAVLVQQSDDDTLAMDVASSHRIAAVRIASAGLIDDFEQLQHVARSARDKSVQQLVRAKVRKQRDAQALQDERANQIDRLISNSAKLIDSADTSDYGARTQVLHDQFEQLQPHIDEAKRHIIERNLRRCSQRASELRADTATDTGASTPATRAPNAPESVHTAAPDAAVDAPVVAPEPESSARNAVLDALAGRVAALDFSDLAACDALLQDTQVQWNTLADEPLSKAASARYGDLLSAVTAAQACHRVLQDQQDQIRALAGTAVDALDNNALSDAQDQLAELIAQLDWPEGHAKPAALTQVMDIGQALTHEHSQRKQAEEQLTRKLDRLVYRMRGQVQRKQLKAALHSERDIEALLEGAGAHTRGAVERKLASARKDLEQLRDWDNFRADPLREALCEKLEALDASPLAPDAQAEAVKAIRQEWRTVNTAPLPQDNPVQQRFQHAADAAFAHCAEWHEQQQVKRQNNLKERERLVSELQQFVDGLDAESADIDVVQRAMRASREEWRHYYPVRHSDAKGCQKQFDRLMDTLHNAVKQGHKRNKHQRDSLIERAESLLQLDDIDTAINQAMALQTEWKDVGPVTHRDQRQQWARFRKPMDALFAKRNTARDAVKAASSAQQAAVQNRIAELKALTDDAAQAVSQRIRAAEDIREDIGQQLASMSPRDASRFSKEADALLETLHLAQRDAPRQRTLEQLHALAALRETLVQLDAAHAAGDTVDTAPVSAEIAHRFGESSSARALLDPRVAALDLPHDAALVAQHTETLSSLLIEIEILTDLPSPDAWRAERRACQIEMLEDRQSANAATPEHVLQLVNQALALGPVASDTPSSAQPLDATRRLGAILDVAPRWLQ